MESNPSSPVFSPWLNHCTEVRHNYNLQKESFGHTSSTTQYELNLKWTFVTNFHLKLTMKVLDPRWHHVNQFLVDATAS
jgi:hypothetical protein